MPARFPLFLILLFSLFASQPLTAQQPIVCDGLPAPQLINGEQGRVLPGTPNNLRVEPDTESDILGEIPAETLFLVVEGPECSDEFVWWQVAYDDLVGWTVENIDDETYVVEPVTPAITPISFGGVSFELDSRVAQTATGQLIPAYNPNNTNLPFWLQTPAFINFALDDSFENLGTMADIAVYPAQALGDVQQSTAIEDLQTLLDNEPFSPTPAALPIVNAEQVFVSQVEYIDFEGGYGVRFVAYYSQSADPLVSSSLWYVFQGLTEQGEHYVQFYLPIVTNLFPATDDEVDYEAFISDYEQYLDEAQTLIDEADADDFAPTLFTLDNMVASLEIDPNAVSATFSGDLSLTVNCQVTAIEDTRLRSAPDVDATVTDYLPADAIVAANGQFQRQGETFPWWRLAENDEILALPGISSLPGERWLRADFTFEDGNCAGLPVINTP